MTPVIDWTISIGNILTASVLLIALFGWTMKLFNRFERAEKRVDSMSDEIHDMRTDMKAIGSVLVQLASTEQSIENLETNIVRIDRDLADLRRGEGFVLPLGGKIR